MTGQDDYDATDSEDTVQPVRSDCRYDHGRKCQFSLATLLVLQTVAGILAVVTKAFGPSIAIAAIILFAILAIPIAGTFWVANNFQQAHQLGKRIGLASFVIYGTGVFVSYIVVWWFG